MSEEKIEKSTPETESATGSPNWHEIKIDDVTGELQKVVNEMPEVVSDAVDAAEAKEQAIKKEQENIVDRKGRAFDPNLHASDPQTGKPLLTPTGRFKSLPKANTAGVNIPQSISAAQSATGQTKVVAQTLVGIFIQSGYGLFGDDWLPEKSKEFDEQQNLEKVTEVYCDNIGLTDLPPGLVLITAFAAYGLRRVNRPRVKSVREKVGEWLRLKTASVWVWYKNRYGKGIKNVKDEKSA